MVSKGEGISPMEEIREKIDGLGADELKMLLGYIKQSIKERDPDYNPDAGYWKE